MTRDWRRLVAPGTVLAGRGYSAEVKNGGDVTVRLELIPDITVDTSDVVSAAESDSGYGFSYGDSYGN